MTALARRALYALLLLAACAVATTHANGDDADAPARPPEEPPCEGDHCVRGDCGKMVEPKESSGMEGVNCKDGPLIPIWPHHENMSAGDRLGRGLLYIILMVYLFLGVAIVSDKFMESIEMITAQEKEVSVKDPRTGKTQVIVVKVWNETV